MPLKEHVTITKWTCNFGRSFCVQHCVPWCSGWSIQTVWCYHDQNWLWSLCHPLNLSHKLDAVMVGWTKMHTTCFTLQGIEYVNTVNQNQRLKALCHTILKMIKPSSTSTLDIDHILNCLQNLYSLINRSHIPQQLNSRHGGWMNKVHFMRRMLWVQIWTGLMYLILGQGLYSLMPHWTQMKIGSWDRDVIKLWSSIIRLL